MSNKYVDINSFLEYIYSILQNNVELHVPKIKFYESNFPQYFSFNLKKKII